jgi:hypothetical protein
MSAVGWFQTIAMIASACYWWHLQDQLMQWLAAATGNECELRLPFARDLRGVTAGCLSALLAFIRL